MTAWRMVLRLANIQQRPERCWSQRSPWGTSTSKPMALAATPSGTRAAARMPTEVTAFLATTLARSREKRASQASRSWAVTESAGTCAMGYLSRSRGFAHPA